MKSKFRRRLSIVSIGMILVTGAMLDILCGNLIKNSLEESIYDNISGVCKETRFQFYKEYPDRGYSIKDNKMYSNDVSIDDELEVLEQLKENFGTEITIFFGDTRYITTIEDENGKKIVGTHQTQGEIVEIVLNGEEYISNKVVINGEKYYGEYIPLEDNGDKVVGMVFAGIKKKDVTEAMLSMYMVVTLITLIIAVAVTFFIYYFADELCRNLEEIKIYLGKLLNADPEVKMSGIVLERKDEIGDLGRYAKNVGEEMSKLINYDPLTQLLNRRSGANYLEKLMKETVKNSIPMSIVMCDLDFFKKINDKFGHELGDDVLEKVSEILRRECDGCHIIRWGGEEFLICSHLDKASVLEMLQSIQQELKLLNIEKNNEKLSITMTFGVAEYTGIQDVNEMIRIADDKLYEGKNAGRNRIVI